MKCDSFGVAYASSPYGETFYYSGPIGNQRSHVTFSIPKPKGVFTIYRYVGFLFPWVCSTVLVLVILHGIYSCWMKRKQYVKQSSAFLSRDNVTVSDPHIGAP